MPARDIYHNNVKNALIKDEWKITHDPLTLKFGKKDLYIYLGASQLVPAEKAIPNSIFEDLFEEPIGKLLLKNHRLKLISFDPKQEVIKQWITPN